MTKPSFVKNRQGLYRLRGAVDADVIINQAAALLLEGLCDGRTLTSARETTHFLQLALANEVNEKFSALFLNHRHQVIAFEPLFQGTIDTAAVHPRVVVQRALLLNAAAVIVAHNHPSGEPEPSRADMAITELLKKSLALLDIRLLDHFIVTRKECISLAERGVL